MVFDGAFYANAVIGQNVVIKSIKHSKSVMNLFIVEFISVIIYSFL